MAMAASAGIWARGAPGARCAESSSCVEVLAEALRNCSALDECRYGLVSGAHANAALWAGAEALATCQDGACTCSSFYGRVGPTCWEASPLTWASVVGLGLLIALSLTTLLYGAYPLAVLKWHGVLPLKASEVTCMFACMSLVGLLFIDARMMVLKVRPEPFPLTELVAAGAFVGLCTSLALLRLALTWVHLARRADRMAAYSTQIKLYKWGIYALSFVWLAATIVLMLLVEDQRITLGVNIAFAQLLGFLLLVGSSAMYFTFAEKRPRTRVGRTVAFSRAFCCLRGPRLGEGRGSRGLSALWSSGSTGGKPITAVSSAGENSSAGEHESAERRAFEAFSARILMAGRRINSLLLLFSAASGTIIWTISEAGRVFRPPFSGLFVFCVFIVHVANTGALAVVFWFFRKSYRARMRGARGLDPTRRLSMSTHVQDSDHHHHHHHHHYHYRNHHRNHHDDRSKSSRSHKRHETPDVFDSAFAHESRQTSMELEMADERELADYGGGHGGSELDGEEDFEEGRRRPCSSGNPLHSSCG